MCTLWYSLELHEHVLGLELLTSEWKHWLCSIRPCPNPPAAVVAYCSCAGRDSKLPCPSQRTAPAPAPWCWEPFSSSVPALTPSPAQSNQSSRRRLLQSEVIPETILTGLTDDAIRPWETSYPTRAYCSFFVPFQSLHTDLNAIQFLGYFSSP